MLHLLGAMSDGNSAYIEGMEADGQRQLVASELLPNEVLHSTDADLEAMGIQLGEPVAGDALFRHATLPAGWRREGGNHAMWSYLVDEHGRRRAQIFYKAAFYDRSAHISVTSVIGYAWAVVNDDQPLVLDDTWATREAVLAALDEHGSREAKQAADWAKRVEETDDPDDRLTADCRMYQQQHLNDAAKFRKIADQVRSEQTGAGR